MVVRNSYVIKSRDRISGTPGNFVVDLKGLVKESSVFRIRKITLPLSYYNVNSSTNTLFIGAPINSAITLIPGQYTTGTQISASIQTELQILDASFVCTFNSLTQRITISRVGNFEIDLDQSTLNTILGFENTGTLSANITYTGTKNFVADPNISISLQSEMLDDGDHHTTNSISNHIFSVAITENMGSVVNFYPPIKEFFPVEKSKTVNFVRFTFLDYKKEIIDFNGVDNEIDLVFLK